MSGTGSPSAPPRRLPRFFTPRRDPEATTSNLPSIVKSFRKLYASRQDCISSRKISVRPGTRSTSPNLPPMSVRTSSSEPLPLNMARYVSLSSGILR